MLIPEIRYNCNDATNYLNKFVVSILRIHARIKIFIIYFSHSLFSTSQSPRKTYKDIFITRPVIFWSRFQIQNLCHDHSLFTL